MPYEPLPEDHTERMTFDEWLHEIVRLEDAAALAGMGRSTLTRLAARGEAPAPARINGKCSVYRKGQIRRWIESQTRPDMARSA